MVTMVISQLKSISRQDFSRNWTQDRLASLVVFCVTVTYSCQLLFILLLKCRRL